MPWLLFLGAPGGAGRLGPRQQVQPQYPDESQRLRHRLDGLEPGFGHGRGTQLEQELCGQSSDCRQGGGRLLQAADVLPHGPFQQIPPGGDSTDRNPEKQLL
uniref:Uncharacterized protein n=1 Tax=Micrurus lemniscatus lemniscatus TaxID=129467 RepID=A0A2D4JAS4_MICLE